MPQFYSQSYLPEGSQPKPIYDRWMDAEEILMHLLSPLVKDLRRQWMEISFKVHVWDGKMEWTCAAAFPDRLEELVLDPAVVGLHVADLVEFQDYAYLPDWNYLEAVLKRTDRSLTSRYYWDASWPIPLASDGLEPQLVYDPEDPQHYAIREAIYQAAIERQQANAIVDPVVLDSAELAVLKEIISDIRAKTDFRWKFLEMTFQLLETGMVVSGYYLEHYKSRPYPQPERFAIESSLRKLSQMAPEYGKSAFSILRMDLNQAGEAWIEYRGT